MRIIVALLINIFDCASRAPLRSLWSGAAGLVLWTFASGLLGCSSLMLPSVLEPMVNGIQYQEDLQLACDGAPSYLLMLDSLLVSKPEDEQILLKATQAYAAYADAMVECGRPERSVLLSEKAKKYGFSLLALNREMAIALTSSLPDFDRALQSVGRDDIDKLFWGGFAWANWIRFQEGSAAALADLTRVEKTMLRVIQLDEAYYHGGAHFFLGFYYGSRPSVYGGNPEQSRIHFEKALAYSGRKLLAVQVAYAQTYAQLTLNRDLYESLLKEVANFPLANAPEHALSNQLAKKRAARLMEDIDKRF